MIEITIDWCDGHNVQDWDGDPDWIGQHLEAGYDQGPLLVIPEPRPGRPKPVPLLFQNVSTYISHLAIYKDQLDGERWIGLVRECEPSEVEDVLAAMHKLGVMSAGSLTRPMPFRVKSPISPPMDYQVLTGPFKQSKRVMIDHQGEGLDELLRYYPTLCLSVILPDKIKR